MAIIQKWFFLPSSCIFSQLPKLDCCPAISWCFSIQVLTKPDASFSEISQNHPRCCLLLWTKNLSWVLIDSGWYHRWSSLVFLEAILLFFGCYFLFTIWFRGQGFLVASNPSAGTNQEHLANIIYTISKEIHSWFYVAQKELGLVNGDFQTGWQIWIPWEF